MKVYIYNIDLRGFGPLLFWGTSHSLPYLLLLFDFKMGHPNKEYPKIKTNRIYVITLK